jgi:hypothetical protein
MGTNGAPHHPKNLVIQFERYPWKIFPTSLAFRTSSTV